MLPIVTALLKSGLSLLANAFLVKGQAWVEDKTGVKLDPQATTLTQEQVVALKQAEMAHEEELQRLILEENKLNAEVDKSYLADRADARSRDVELHKAGFNNQRADNLAYMAVGGFLGLGFLVILGPRIGIAFEASTKELLMYILGSLNTVVVMIYQFEFGSSKDAAKLNNAMMDQLNGQ